MAVQDVTCPTAQDGVAGRVPTEVELRAAAEESARKAEWDCAGPRVVVQGLGLVGAAVATSATSVADGRGRPLYFVAGVDLPTPGS